MKEFRYINRVGEQRRYVKGFSHLIRDFSSEFANNGARSNK